jgi:hypothetical protein
MNVLAVIHAKRSPGWVLFLVILLFGAINAGEAQARLHGPAAGRVLGGITKNQHEPVVVAVSKNANRVTVVLDLDMTCTSGAQFTQEEIWPRLAVARNGFVHGASAIAPDTSAGLLGGSHSLTGLLDRKHAIFVGKAQLHVNYSLPNGQTDSCDSGAVSLSAVL